MEGRNICIAFHFADKSASVGCVCRKCVSSLLVTVFQLRQTHNEFGAFSRRWIKDWFQFVVPVAFASELTPLFSIRRPK